ncbi:deoxyribonucleotide triphosphate pyrophosphatase [Candidatus Termititenax spirochaetophilus]|uniref:dITP/XTP pyrophosphatase n=1 Tax=Candidatus Termititenax spirochaetophilus TaxID=2218522 RepID=A0A388T8G0_9BACT|nr:deoxyribonucleotide triphosphate pyrophosphatase [Candidatus Termititenax spirochaetophilus]
MKLVIASRNKHKVAEIQAILSQVSDLEIASLDGYDVPEIIEDRDTFLGNASKKALETAKYINAAVLADDSGLMVDALNGAPGVYSARYAGEGASSAQLCEKLLSELKNVPPEKRTAHFVTTLVIAAPDGKILHTAEGKVDGVITEAMHGANGFGYDPVFYCPPLNKTFAELEPAEKNQHSHRWLALQNLLVKLRQ